MTKRCTGCKKKRLIKFFYLRKERPGQYRSKCVDCSRDRVYAWRDKNIGAFSTYQRTYRHKRRMEVLNHYSPERLECACCKESRWQFLSIDHINGGGTKHREETGHGFKFYTWLIRNGFPSGYRILCHNCNMAFGIFGACPHEEVNSQSGDCPGCPTAAPEC